MKYPPEVLHDQTLPILTKDEGSSLSYQSSCRRLKERTTSLAKVPHELSQLPLAWTVNAIAD